MNGDGRPDLFVVGLHRRQRPGPSSDSGLPEQLPGRPRPALPQHGERRERPRHVPRGRRARRGIDTGTPEHGLGAVFTDVERRRPPRPLRRERREPEPALPERRRGRAAPRPTRWASASGSRSAPRARASPTRTPAWASPPPTTAATAAPTSSSPTRTSSCTPSSAAARRTAASPRSRDARSDIAPAFDTSLAGWGASWVDLDNDAQPRSRARERRHPGDRPREERRAGAGLREPDRARPSGTVRSARAARSGWTRLRASIGRGLAAADFDNDGHVDIAVNSIGGKLMLLRNTGAKGNWLEVRLAAFAPGRRRHRRAAGRAPARAGAARRQQLPLVRGSARPLRAREARRRCDELIVRYPGGRETRLTDVAANQVLAVGR